MTSTAENSIRQTKNPQLPGDKRLRLRCTIDCGRTGRKTRERFFGKLGQFKSDCVYWKIQKATSMPNSEKT